MHRYLHFFYIAALSAIIFTSCKESHPRELKMLDELDLVLDSCEQALGYDLVTLDNRKKHINFQLNQYSRFNKDTFTLELGNKLSKYKEISKVYKYFIKNYEGSYNRLKQLQRQSLTLRNSVVDNKLSKEEFKKFYADELNNAQVLLKKTRGDSEFIPKLEPEFQRLNIEVSNLLLGLAQKEPKLKKILEDAESDSTN